MRIKNNQLKAYVFKIFKLIFLTDLICVLLFTQKILIITGYIIGSLAGFLNFYFQAINAENKISSSPIKAKLSSFKNFYLRYFILIVILFLIVKFININIFALISGLIIVQIIIFIEGITEYKKEKNN